MMDYFSSLKKPAICSTARSCLIPTAIALGLTIGCSRSQQSDIEISQSPLRDSTATIASAAADPGQTEDQHQDSPARVDSPQNVSPQESHGDEASETRSSESIPVDESTTDSDEPGGYERPETDESASSVDLPNAAKANGDDVMPESKRDRRADEDDPDAPILVRKDSSDSRPAEPPLDNGRGDSARRRLGKLAESDRSSKTDSPSPDAAMGKRVPENDGRADAKPVPTGRADTKVDGKGKASPTVRSAKKLDELSADVRSLDKDGDGQIGLYEWPRTKIGQFTELDSNQDGFLTPQELLDGAEGPSSQSGDSPAAARSESGSPEPSADDESEGRESKTKPVTEEE